MKLQENSSSASQQWLSELSSSSQIENIIQEGDGIFLKKTTVGLP